MKMDLDFSEIEQRDGQEIIDPADEGAQSFCGHCGKSCKIFLKKDAMYFASGCCGAYSYQQRMDFMPKKKESVMDAIKGKYN